MEIFLLLIVLLVLLNCSTFGAEVESNKIRKSLNSQVELDSEKKVILGWEVDSVGGNIIFELEAETEGWVALGFSPHGIMSESDLFISGVFPNGTFYSSDRFCPVGENTAEIDKHSDWILIAAEEVTIASATKAGHKEVIKTYVKFSRLLDTCDNEDFPIVLETEFTRVIWAIGETDEIEYHGAWRGTKAINFTREPILSRVVAEYNQTKLHALSANVVMPEDETSFWCTFHELPVLKTKHHVISWKAHLNETNAIKYVSHLTVYNCSTPRNNSSQDIFKNFTVDKFKGDYCFAEKEEGSDVISPMEHCTDFLYGWGKGLDEFSYPEDVGYEIGGTNEVHYYMLEVHYNNPDFLSDIRFNATVYMNYTSKLRKMDAGVLWVGHGTRGLIVPPDAFDFTLAGHCSPTCSKLFPPSGITIFNVMLNAHISGKQIKLRHFRKGKGELPWIAYDQYYDNNFQESKPLSNVRQVLPGDHLILECTFDTRWKNGTVAIDELCQGFLWYYPKIEVEICGSAYPALDFFTDFGITEYHNVSAIEVEVDAPPALSGEFEDVLNYKFNWTPSFIENFETKRRYGWQNIICYSSTQDKNNTEHMNTTRRRINYPLSAAKSRQYSPPPSICEGGVKTSVEEKVESKTSVASRKSLQLIFLSFYCIVFINS